MRTARWPRSFFARGAGDAVMKGAIPRLKESAGIEATAREAVSVPGAGLFGTQGNGLSPHEERKISDFRSPDGSGHDP